MAESGYAPLSRLLHRVALAGDAVADLSQEIEFRINPGARAAD